MKYKTLLIIVSFIIMIIACSGTIKIDFYGRITGYNPKDSSSYKLYFYDRGSDVARYEAKPVLDSEGNYVVRMEFWNVVPQRVSLIRNMKLVDMYCFNEIKNNYKGLVNIFTGNVVKTPEKFHWSQYEIKNLDFNDQNYKIDSNKLMFDSTTISMIYDSAMRRFNFTLDDPTFSTTFISTYYFKSDWIGRKVELANYQFTIPENDLENHDIDFENTLFLEVHSKYGWSKIIPILIWKTDIK